MRRTRCGPRKVRELLDGGAAAPLGIPGLLLAPGHPLPTRWPKALVHFKWLPPW